MSSFITLGTKVYCPQLGNEILTVRKDEDGLYVDDGWNRFDINGCGETGIETIDDCMNITVVFHATPENKAALETLYGMEFESV